MKSLIYCTWGSAPKFYTQKEGRKKKIKNNGRERVILHTKKFSQYLILKIINHKIWITRLSYIWLWPPRVLLHFICLLSHATGVVHTRSVRNFITKLMVSKKMISMVK